MSLAENYRDGACRQETGIWNPVAATYEQALSARHPGVMPAMFVYQLSGEADQIRVADEFFLLRHPEHPGSILRPRAESPRSTPYAEIRDNTVSAGISLPLTCLRAKLSFFRGLPI